MFSLLLLAAQAAAPPAEAPAPHIQPKRICERVHVVGSVRSRRVCRTKEEVAQRYAEGRKDVDRMREQLDRSEHENYIPGPVPEGPN